MLSDIVRFRAHWRDSFLVVVSLLSNVPRMKVKMSEINITEESNYLKT